MVQRVKETRHPVLTSFSALSRGILRMLKRQETIHFNANPSNTELLFRIMRSVNQPIFKKQFRKGVEQRNTKEREFTRTLWSLLQGLNWHLETACGKTFRTSNPCPRLQFTKVCELEQTQNPDLLQQLLEEQLLDQSLKFTSYKHLAPMDLKSKVNLQII